MAAKDRLDLLLEHENMDVKALAEKIGIPAHRLYDINRGRSNNITSFVAKAITDAMPYYNFTWLTIGSGDMINQDKEQKIKYGHKENQEESITLLADNINKLTDAINRLAIICGQLADSKINSNIKY